MNVRPDACAVSFERPPATCTDACLHYETSTAFSFIIVAKRLLVMSENHGVSYLFSCMSCAWEWNDNCNNTILFGQYGVSVALRLVQCRPTVLIAPSTSSRALSELSGDIEQVIGPLKLHIALKNRVIG